MMYTKTTSCNLPRYQTTTTTNTNPFTIIPPLSALAAHESYEKQGAMATQVPDHSSTIPMKRRYRDATKFKVEHLAYHRDPPIAFM